MIALLRTELRRCWSRRSVHLFGALALAGIALAGILVFINSAKPTASFNVVDLKDVFQGASIPLLILGIALAASFIGAEWSAGTMTTLLTWETRRGRVYGAKLLAAAIFTLISAVLLLILLGLALLPSALAHGSSAGVNAHWYAAAAGSIARGALVATLGAAMGLALGSLARNTTAAVIIVFVYLFVFENLIRGLKPNLIGWLFGDNADIFIIGHKLNLDMGSGPTLTHGPIPALLAICAYAAILTTAAVILFLRRDVA